MTRALDAELTRLCAACGVCCNGTMFERVKLDPGELSPDTRKRLRVAPGEAEGSEVALLGCSAFVAAGATTAGGCGVYQDRPRRCREYGCALYREHAHDPRDLDAKLAKVGRIAELAAKLGRVWCEPAITDPAMLLDAAELASRLRRDLGWSAGSPRQPKEMRGVPLVAKPPRADS